MRLLLALVCTVAFSAELTFAAAAEPLPVFIFVGQSNMSGADSAVSPADPGKKAGDTSVLFWNRSAYQGKEWENDSAFHPLRVQNSKPYGGDIIGPEYGFAREVQAARGLKRMAIVKVSFPSTSMAGEWKKSPAGVGFAYAALQEEMMQAMKALRDAGETPRVTAILVHQGISDALHGETQALAYAGNLRAFIDHVRAEFAAADTPVVLARENMSPLAKREQMETVRESTVRVAESTPHAAWIDVDGLDRVKGHHFTAAAQMEIGKRYATACFALLQPHSVALPVAGPAPLAGAVETDPRLHANGAGWRLDKAAIKDLKRPRVLLIGDSILNGYQPHVIAALDGKAYVDAWVNPYHQSDLVNQLLTQVLDQGPYDVVHFNMGLHGWPKGRIKDGTFEPLTRAYVEVIRRRLPKAKIIWASSTPTTVKGDPSRMNPEVNPVIIEHNRMAAKVMKEMQVPVNDLYALLIPTLTLIGSDGIHWQPEGSKLMAKTVTEFVLKALPGDSR